MVPGKVCSKIELKFEISAKLADQSYAENMTNTLEFRKSKIYNEKTNYVLFFLNDRDGHTLKVRQTQNMLTKQNLANSGVVVESISPPGLIGE